MVTHQLDSQSFVKRMEAAGMQRALAEELAGALGSVMLDGLSTRRDVHDAELRLDEHLRETELRPRQYLENLELRTTLRFGTMLVATTTLIIAVLGALIALK